MNEITHKSTSPPLSVLERQIIRAEKDLIESRSQSLDDDGGTAILFTGNHHDSYPRHLVLNSELAPVDKVTWQVIRLSIVDPSRPGSTPRRDEIATMVGCSLPVVTTSRMMLRIRRWMTFCRSVRHVGRFVGDIYLLNDEPLSLQATLDLDATYIQFLEGQLQSSSKRHKQAAAEALREVERLQTGSQPSEVEVMSSRVNRAMSDASFLNNQRKNFAPVQTLDSSQNQQDLVKSNAEIPQSKNFNLDKSLQNKNLSLDGKKNLASDGKNFLASPGSSSSYINNKKYITAPARVNRDDRDLPQNADDQATLKNHRDDRDDRDDNEKTADSINAWGRWGLKDDRMEMPWLEKHLPFLAYRPFEPWLLCLVAARSSVLPAIYRKTLHLTPEGRTIVLAQLLGKVVCSEKGFAERIRDPIAYTHKLVGLWETNQLVPDEWALELLRSYKDREGLQGLAALEGIN